MKGIYTLIIDVRKDVDCRIGSLGSFSFSKGVYAYTGSGQGVASVSIEGRIERHLGRRKRKFWHIDYLLSLRTCGVRVSVHSETAANVECNVNRTIQESTSGVFLVSGFGSSDCNCVSHLIYLPLHSLNKATHSVMSTYRELLLKPRVRRFN